MRIEETNSIKVCDVILNKIQKDKKLWDIIWFDKISKKILKQENGRCYFIVVNGDIYKIGYSDQTGGIQATITTYRSSGNSGRPSDRTYGIHILIAEELIKGNKVEFYFSYNEDIEIDLPVMDGSIRRVKTSISGKTLEIENMKIFTEKVGLYPKWNFQEANLPWPKYIQDGRLRVFNGISTSMDDVKKILGINS